MKNFKNRDHNFASPVNLQNNHRVGSQYGNPWAIIRKCLNNVESTRATRRDCILVQADSRKALPILPDSSVSCIITSPPYAGLKNYGTSDQIGFGQNRDKEYLPDIKKTLVELYRIARTGAALWIVLDTVKESGETVPLPWEVITRAREAEWIFQDLVVWDKGKSLPWSHEGRFRGVCEYVLLFGKGKLACFNLDAVRDVEHLSSYWMKYPERYHPDGKAPTDLWHFPTPVQGGWNNSQARHFCPFPVGLIARMVALTTRLGDIVIDPFSGTGSVAAVASFLGRFGIGIELNPLFVQEFDQRGYDLIINRAKAELPKKGAERGPLHETIIDLRILKYPKTLFAQISRGDRMNGTARESIAAFLIRSAVHTENINSKMVSPRDLGRIKLQVLLKQNADISAVASAIQKRILVPPLSKFGIRASVQVVPFERWSTKRFIRSHEDELWYVYRKGKFYHYEAQLQGGKLVEALQAESNDIRRKLPSIFSKVKLELHSSIND